MVIMQEAVPGLKGFLKPLATSRPRLNLVARLIIAVVMHWGRMSSSQAAGAVRSQPRHRAQIGRFLGRKFWKKCTWSNLLRQHLLAFEKRTDTYVFIVDQTLCSHQGQKSENTYSAGNRLRRPCKGRRYNKKKYTPKSCHCFVMGLLLTPSGVRLPFFKSYFTKAYSKAKGIVHRTQTDLAAQLIFELPLEGVPVIVLGDTAFDAESIRQACAERDYTWIVPMNSERVLEKKKPRPKVRSLVNGLKADQFQTVRLHASRGKWVAERRISPYRMGPKVKATTYYVHEERREVHSVGNVLLVFSTRKLPKQKKERVKVQKILMTNNRGLSASAITELYALRWQIELFFKELKTTLGLKQYCYREFDRVESWVELVLMTFMYLESYRASQLRRRDLSKKQKKWWQWQRSYGLCTATREATEQADLERIGERLKTRGGLKQLKRLIQNATQREYRHAA